MTNMIVIKRVSNNEVVVDSNSGDIYIYDIESLDLEEAYNMLGIGGLYPLPLGT